MKIFFLFFETFDFTKNLKKKGKKLFAVKKIKFNHMGALVYHQNLIT